ncbi:MAG: RNA polymerase sigma factor [Syntrophobacterales bacterium]|nr:RNA polymerase sigma factor [Syntrophobacterales bacterium]
MDFYEVYDQYFDRIRSFILGTVKNRWIADDLVQETFFRVLQKMDEVRDEAKLSSWIYRIAANLCQDHFRSAKRNPLSLEANPAKELAGEFSLDQQMEQYQVSLWVQDLVSRLREPQRQVLELCDIKQASYREAADFLGLSVENVKVRLHRGRKQLKALLEEEGHLAQEARGFLNP